MATRFKLALLLVACELVACSPVPVVPPADPGPSCSTQVECACAQLAALGCAEGGPQCVATLEHVLESRLTPLDPECISAARTKAAARACAVECAQ